MYTKLDQPIKSKDVSSNNTGSCQRIMNYLFDEDKIDGKFFNQFGSNITKKQAVELIDYNVKGLKKEELKFYSLTLNPSKEELEVIKNDPEKLKSFTRNVMADFAKNITNQNVNPDELVWAAIIHDKRHYTNLDKYKYEKKEGKPFPHKTLEDIESWKVNNPNIPCPFEKEVVKDGNNAHVHIVVSRKNFEMDKTITLHGRNSKDKFNLLNWQSNNQKRFQDQFNYRKGDNLFKSYHEKIIEKHIDKIHSTGFYLDKEKILKKFGKLSASDQQVFMKNMSRMSYKIKKGQIIKDPEYFLEKGFDKKETELISNKMVSDLESFIYENQKDINSYDSIASFSKKRKRKKRQLKQ